MNGDSAAAAASTVSVSLVSVGRRREGNVSLKQKRRKRATAMKTECEREQHQRSPNVSHVLLHYLENRERPRSSITYYVRPLHSRTEKLLFDGVPTSLALHIFSDSGWPDPND